MVSRAHERRDSALARRRTHPISSPRGVPMRTHPEQRPPIRPHQRSPSAPIHTDDLQQIGLRHPRVRQIRDVINNAGPNHRRLLVAEGLWAHNVVLDLGAPIDTFLWCPEASYSDEALVRSAEVVARARSAYRISPTVMARICERERPDG